MPPNSGAWAAILYPATESISTQTLVFSGGETLDTSPVSALPEPVGCLVVPPEGLGLPSVRAGDVIYERRDGVAQTADWYEPRVITLTVEVASDQCFGCEDVRTRVRRIERGWSRASSPSRDFFWLVLYPDCYDPDLICTEDQEWSGPYMIFGRPRGLIVTWHESDQTRATLTLRFDAMDHRIIMPCLSSDPLSPWAHSQCAELFSQGLSPVRTNLAPDPTLRTTGFYFQDATGIVTRPDDHASGPHGQGFFQFEITDPGVSASPWFVYGGQSGTQGIPVTPGEFYAVSGYWWADTIAETENLQVTWYGPTGLVHSTVTSPDVNIPTANNWFRSWFAVEVPAGAAFMRAQFVWNGKSVTLGANADLLIELDPDATSTLDVSAPSWYFNGDYFGEWNGSPDSSSSDTRYVRRNLSWNPRGENVTHWGWRAPSGGGWAVTITGESEASTGLSGPTLNTVDPNTPPIDTWVRFTMDTVGDGVFRAIQFSNFMRHGAYGTWAAGNRVYLQIYGRTNRSDMSGRVSVYGLTDEGSIVNIGQGSSAFALNPNEWQGLFTVTNTVSQDGIVGFCPGMQFETGTFQPGDWVEVTAAYVEAEEFIDQPAVIHSWFDANTFGAARGVTDVPLGPSAQALPAGEQNTTSFEILGTQCVPLNFMLTGPLTAEIQIIVMFEGETFTYRILEDIPAGETWLLDGSTRSLYNEAGTEQIGGLAFSGNPGPVGPGEVQMIVLTGDAGDTGSVQVCWENTVVGA